jgi:hypothetical protein
MMGASPDALVTLEILPAHQFEPGKVLYTIRIPPHRDNFWTCYGWDNLDTEKGRTSCQQLNGIYAPRIFQQEYRNLEPGRYVGFLETHRVPNYIASIDTQNFVVLSLFK